MAIHLSETVRAARVAAGLTRAELELRAELPARSVERLERRGQRPRRAELERLAAALGLDVETLDDGAAALPLPATLDGLVVRHGAEQLLVEAVAAVFRRKV